MKPTDLPTKCLSATGRPVRSRATGAPVRAHSPVRRQNARARFDAAPAEAETGAGPARLPLLPDTAGPRVLHVDTETGTAAVLAGLLGDAVHVTHVATLAQARQLLQAQIFSLVILDPALPDGDAKELLALLGGTPLLIYSDRQPLWRDPLPPLFLPKSSTTARQLWTALAALLWNTSALSAGD